MRGASIIAAGGLVGLSLSCLPAGQFRCVDSADCSGRSGGACEESGFCSYPDPDCESERRYSEFAGEHAGQCVAPGDDPATSTPAPTGADGGGSSTGDTGDASTSDGGSTSGGPVPGGCEGIDCSGVGRCVVVDDAATCACEPGWYAVGVECLEDPCDAAPCIFVDAEAGDDEAEGTREAPWKTIARVEAELPVAPAGTHVLLRRGRTWADQLDIGNTEGEVDAPIVVGAYGPIAEPRPRLFPGAVRIHGSEHVVVRDLQIHDDLTVAELPNRPCVMVERSSHVSIVGNDLRDCVNRGIRTHDGVAYMVVADNTIRGVRTNEPIFLADTTWVDPIPYTGPHHWVIDNVLVGSDTVGLRVALADLTTDVKVVGNVVTDTAASGIAVTAEGFVWIAGNTIARAQDLEADTGVGIYANVGELAVVTGNVVLESRRGMEIGREAIVRHNTVLGTPSTLEVALLRAGAGVQSWSDNLLLAATGAVSVRDADGGAGPDVVFGSHWYAPDCTFAAGSDTLDLAAWQAALMSDASSVCADGPGVVAPTAGLDPDAWDAAFTDALVPDTGWERCGQEAGAYACDGARLDAGVDPIADYFEADGFGWEGTLFVRQRYPAP